MNCEFVGQKFLNDGGPMLVMSAHQLSEWKGAPLDDDDDDEAILSGDYGRACEIDDATGLLEIPSGIAVAISCDDHYYPMQWLRCGEDWIVVGWAYGEDDAEAKLLTALRSGALPEWTSQARNLPIRDGLVLLHAVDEGSEHEVPAPSGNAVTALQSGLEVFGQGDKFVGIGDALVAHASDGNYDLSYVLVEFDKGTEIESVCALWRWSPSR